MLGEAPVAKGLADAEVTTQYPGSHQANQETKLEVAAVEEVGIEFTVSTPVGHLEHGQCLWQAADGAQKASGQSSQDKSTSSAILPRPGESVISQERDPSKRSQNDHLHERTQGLKSHQAAGRHHPEHRSAGPESLKPPKNPRKPGGGVLNGNMTAMEHH